MKGNGNNPIEQKDNAQEFFDNTVKPVEAEPKKERDRAYIRHAWFLGLVVSAVSSIILFATFRQLSVFVGSHYLYEGVVFFLWIAVFFRSALKSFLAIDGGDMPTSKDVRKRLSICGFTIGLLMAYVPTASYFLGFLGQDSFDLFYIVAYILIVVVPPAYCFGATLGELMYFAAKKSAVNRGLFERLFIGLNNKSDAGVALVWYRGFDGALFGALAYAGLSQIFRVDSITLAVSILTILATMATYSRKDGWIKTTLAYVMVVMFISVIYTFNQAGDFVVSHSTVDDNYSILPAKDGEGKEIAKNNRIIVKESPDKSQYVRLVSEAVSASVAQEGVVVVSGLSLIQLSDYMGGAASIFNQVESEEALELYENMTDKEFDRERIIFGSPSLLGVKMKRIVDGIFVDAVAANQTVVNGVVDPSFLNNLAGRLKHGGVIGLVVPSRYELSDRKAEELAGNHYASCRKELSYMAQGVSLIKCLKA